MDIVGLVFRMLLRWCWEVSGIVKHDLGESRLSSDVFEMCWSSVGTSFAGVVVSRWCQAHLGCLL